jgi:hypothetical protein
MKKETELSNLELLMLLMMLVGLSETYLSLLMMVLDESTRSNTKKKKQLKAT